MANLYELFASDGSNDATIDFMKGDGDSSIGSLHESGLQIWLVAGLGIKAVQAVFVLTLGGQPKFAVLATATTVFPRPPNGVNLPPGVKSEDAFPHAFLVIDIADSCVIDGVRWESHPQVHLVPNKVDKLGQEVVFEHSQSGVFTRTRRVRPKIIVRTETISFVKLGEKDGLDVLSRLLYFVNRAQRR
ncbi:hypothetical protein EDB80DRAFT_867636 [Ilyonectria destructans]|nr:hypothetical protein EDB80DRAFT_867636 [Ilyonectria destructans]